MKMKVDGIEIDEQTVVAAINDICDLVVAREYDVLHVALALKCISRNIERNGIRIEIRDSEMQQ